MSSTDYYDKHADAFFDRTIHVDMQQRYAKFLPLLPPKARILDAGCGSGRDSAYFKSLGFDVVATDGSIEMVKRSSQLIGAPTLHLTFQEMSFMEEFDAVWASASLLHTPYEELFFVINTLYRSLKPNGIVYASFKYGEGRRKGGDGRIFYDMNEKTIVPYLRPLFEPIHIWVAADSRSGQGHPPWLAILAKKLGTI